MPKGPAARPTDQVLHPLPGVLMPGPGSFNVLIGFLPAWRGVPAAVAAALSAAKQVSDTANKVAEVVPLVNGDSPSLPEEKSAEEATKATAAATMGAMISGAAATA